MKTYSKYIDNYYNIKRLNTDTYKIIHSKLPIKRAGFEEKRKYKRPRGVHDSKLANSIARARTRVFEYAACNNFDYFITLTINGDKLNRYDLGEYIKKLGQFIRDYRKKYGVDVQYLLIPERHEDGAWHMHGLIKGIPKEHLNKNKHGYLDWQEYKDKFGYCSIDRVRCQEAVSKYITKYLRKSFDTGGGVTEIGSKLYYSSRGLKRPEKIKEGTLHTDQMYKIPFEYENDYVRVGLLNSKQFEQVASMLDDSIIPYEL